MRSFFCLAVCSSLPFFPPTPGQTPVTGSASAPALEHLIQQLGEPDFRIRQKASKAIAALGTPALPELQKLRSHRDPEVRRRVDELVASLERAAALSPKQITLQVEKKPIRDVLSQMAKQTGFKIPTSDATFNGPAGKTLYTFHFDKTPFWEALDQVCETSGLVLQQSGNDTLQLSFQDNYEPFKWHAGAFRVTATGFNYYRNTNLAYIPRNPGQPGNQASENLQLNLMVAVEPRLPILKVGQVKLAVAEDEQKCSMLCNENFDYYSWMWRRYRGGQQRTFFQQTSVNLSWPSKSCRTVKVVKGIIPVTLLADQKTTVVTDDILSSKGKKFQVGPATFNIDDITKLAGTQYQFKISYNESSDDNAYDYNRLRSVQQRLELQDAQGQKYPANVQLLMFNGPTSAQFQLSTRTPAKNSKIGPPAKLVYQLWIQMEHEVAFEFKDLPLP